ncbi:MAG: SPFH domain-containing protein [Gemmatimonadota bacterium]|jgi:regulator of protease activity HflC (stomatin/prohibitin superfamily)|nr:SPFH domain-containing protein [Gemmatimonadota bacterium]MDQ8148192.1 SPFH domain-containing protein [Gemmatimonadota bacterium]MDQ8149948.1 SPFH domain-containing protein [Gemmatimonadota bacterium]MDQ8177633.1 SPFH domain-containing protein [Gemmatimonadota bacterium]
MPRQASYKAAPGLLMLFALLAGSAALAWFTATRFIAGANLLGLIGAITFITALVCLGGFFIVQPNEAKALVLFGTYKGTVNQDGFWWANPLMTKQSISLRVRNFETAKLKVNDSHSNPIEIGAIVVWKVVDSAEALFEVDDYLRYVEVQAESALRTVATQYPYDSHAAGEHSLSTHTEEVSHALESALADRLRKAGVEVVEARISHLAYSPEIAAAMLQRQQASAIIAARQKIVEGAVGMVEMALGMLSEKAIVQLDEERKAAMVSNLLVVLCSERSSQPVVNAGSIY